MPRMRPGRRDCPPNAARRAAKMRARLLGGVGVALGLWACAARAEEVAWRPIATTSSAVARAVEPTPAATLLRPVPVAQSTAPEANVTPVGYTPQPAATF